MDCGWHGCLRQKLNPTKHLLIRCWRYRSKKREKDWNNPCMWFMCPSNFELKMNMHFISHLFRRSGLASPPSSFCPFILLKRFQSPIHAHWSLLALIVEQLLSWMERLSSVTPLGMLQRRLFVSHGAVIGFTLFSSSISVYNRKSF